MTRRIIDPSVHRTAVAHHEAGHAVLDIVTGLKFRYITMRARTEGAEALVMTTGAAPRGAWRNEASAMFAGVIAEDMWWIKFGPPTYEGNRRRILTQHYGKYDMRYARDLIRRARVCQRADPSYSLTRLPLSRSVLWMATEAWRYAVVTLAAHGPAVRELAELLLHQPRAVTYAQARKIVGACGSIDTSESHPSGIGSVYPWFLDYSRLSWDARSGQHMPEFIEPVAARHKEEL